MPYLRNVKDPTEKHNKKTKCGRVETISIPIFLFVCLLQLLENVKLLEGSIGQPYNGHLTLDVIETQQNVTCIAHDTKFTCDCGMLEQDLMLPHLMGFVYQVEISNCRSLTITANSLEETQGLRKISFKHIDRLVLEKYSLAFPRYASNTPLIVEFEQVNFELIDSHAINGNIEEISFVGGRIGVIKPFGFTTLKQRALLLRMDQVNVQRIEQQAFKKFAVEQLEIIGCTFTESLPSKAFYELEVLKLLLLQHNHFEEVHTRAFSFQLISKLNIVNNHFRSNNAEWIEAAVSEPISIRENNFGETTQISFKGLSIHRDYVSSERLELQFINNTVKFATDPRPLDFNSRFQLTLHQLRYENVYDCANVEYPNKGQPQPKQVFFQVHCDQVYFLRGSTVTTTTATMEANGINQSFLVLSKIIELDCQTSSNLLYIIIGVVLLLLVLLIAAIGWCYYAKKRQHRRKMEVVMPEPRTYKETQIIYQIENAGLLKTDL